MESSDDDDVVIDDDDADADAKVLKKSVVQATVIKSVSGRDVRMMLR